MSPDIVYFFLQHSPGGVISESKTQNCAAGKGEFLGRMGSKLIDPSAFFSTFTSPVFWCQAGSFSTKHSNYGAQKLPNGIRDKIR